MCIKLCFPNRKPPRRCFRCHLITICPPDGEATAVNIHSVLMQPCLSEIDEITPEKAIIKSESRCQPVTLLVHDLTFDGVMTGSLSHSQSVLSSRCSPISVFLLLRLLLQMKRCLCQSENFMDQ